VEKIAYKPLRGAPRLSPLISAIGMSIFLQNYVMLAQTPDFLPFPRLMPELPLGPLQNYIGSSGVFIILATAVSCAGLTLFIKFTRMGKAMRATAQNSKMAMLVGVNVDRVISLTFIIGSGLAAVGGVLIASHVGQINFMIGFLAGLKAFTAAVLGGIGSIPGAMLGGLVLGWTESFATGYVSSDYEDVFAFLLFGAHPHFPAVGHPRQAADPEGLRPRTTEERKRRRWINSSERFSPASGSCS
jgi:Branched-chain amino acid ABC-type transport system, permease components